MIANLTPYRHSDKTTDVSLYDLRAQIIRYGIEAGNTLTPGKSKMVAQNGSVSSADSGAKMTSSAKARMIFPGTI